MSSDTPRTEAAIIDFEYDTVMYGGEIGSGSREIIDPDFARMLEREITALRAQLAGVLEVSMNPNCAHSVAIR